MMAKCSACGFEQAEGLKFCGECGTKMQVAKEQLILPVTPLEEIAASAKPETNPQTPAEEIEKLFAALAASAKAAQPEPISVLLQKTEPKRDEVFEVVAKVVPKTPEPMVIAEAIVEPDEPEPLPPTHTPRFVTESGDEVAFPLSPNNVWMVGRDDPIAGIHPEVDLTAYDVEQTISRRHAQISLQGKHAVLTSLTATNWTKVNNDRLKHNAPKVLKNGDRIEFAKCTVTFRYQPEK